MIRRLVSAAAAVTSVTLLAIAGPVSAHIDPDPTEGQAGSRLTVGFTVEHGCEGSPTVQLDMRLPDGVTDALAEPVDGWVGSVESIEGDTIVTFAGGPLADDVEGTFEVSMTLPPTPDVTIYFPFVQRCEVGEIRWIGIPSTPGDALDEPAPAMVLTGPVATTVVPAATAPETAVAQTTTTEEPGTTEPATTGAPTTETAAPVEPATTEPALISSGPDENGDSGTGTIVFIASIVAVLGLGAIVIVRSRQARAAAGGDAARNGTRP